MTSITFDTLTYTKKLENSGFTRSQAEAVADALRNMTATQELLTQKDLAKTKVELQQQIAETKAELQQQIVKAQHELLKWLIGMITTQTVVLAGIIAYLK